MAKMSLQELQDLFTHAPVRGVQRVGKHAASKRGYKHNHQKTYVAPKAKMTPNAYKKSNRKNK